MTPSNIRLLEGIRDKTVELGIRLRGDTHAEIVDDIHLMLDELFKRHDFSFYKESYEKVRCLIEEGNKLLVSRADAELVKKINDLLALSPCTLDQDWNSEKIGREFGIMIKVLNEVIDSLTSESEEGITPYLDSVCQWEAEQVKSRVSHAQSASHDSPAFNLTPERMCQYLKHRFPEWKDIKVTRLHKLPGGFSKTTVFFETNDQVNGKQSLVMRAEKQYTPFHMDGADIRNEFYVLKFVHQSGIKVAEPLWLEEDESILGMRFLVSKSMEGEVYGSVNQGSVALSMDTIRDVVEGLVSILRTRLDPCNEFLQQSHLKKWLQYSTMSEFTREFVKYWHRMSIKNNIGASPIFTRGINWLLNNVPECDDPPMLVHGDYSLHNILIKEGQLNAILDWEAVHVGDPADGFKYFTMALSHVIASDKLMEMYHELGGPYISEYRLRYFDVLAILKSIITGYGGLSSIESDRSVDPKVANVGYRIAPVMLQLFNDAIARAESAKALES